MSATNIYSAGGKAGDGDAILERGEKSARRLGVTNAKADTSRLFPGMDTRRFITKPVDINVTMDSVMSVDQAAATTRMLLQSLGLDKEDDSVMVGMVHAICICMALNSSSVLVPGRAKFYIDGSEFDFFTDVMVKLGNNARRYFRAYADVTRACLQGIIDEYRRGRQDGDSGRFDKVCDMHAAIMYVAEKRGLTRAPDLIHDSAEFCTNKTTVEITMLTHSKQTIFATGAYITNPVDHPEVARTRQSRPAGPMLSSVAGGDMPDGF